MKNTEQAKALRKYQTQSKFEEGTEIGQEILTKSLFLSLDGRHILHLRTFRQNCLGYIQVAHTPRGRESQWKAIKFYQQAYRSHVIVDVSLPIFEEAGSITPRELSL